MPSLHNTLSREDLSLFDALPSHPPIDIRVQQRNGRKNITTVAGLSSFFTPEEQTRLQAHLKRTLKCGSSHAASENAYLFQGDHRVAIRDVLLSTRKVDKNDIRLHGA